LLIDNQPRAWFGIPMKRGVERKVLLMRNLLALLAAFMLTFAGVGWYLGWFQVRSHAGTEGNRTVNIDNNTKKINVDLKKGENEILQKVEEKLKDNLNKKPTNDLGGQVDGFKNKKVGESPKP
jgi:hypothetical protein